LRAPPLSYTALLRLGRGHVALCRCDCRAHQGRRHAGDRLAGSPPHAARFVREGRGPGRV